MVSPDTLRAPKKRADVRLNDEPPDFLCRGLDTSARVLQEIGKELSAGDSLSQKAVHLTTSPLAKDAIPFLLGSSLSVSRAKRLLPLLAVHPIGDILKEGWR